jgi:protein involved in polysaccharide export with SLBB domain
VKSISIWFNLIFLSLSLAVTAACSPAGPPQKPSPSASPVSSPAAPPPPVPMAVPAQPVAAAYIIGPGDTIEVFVWRNAELSATVPVRPDGKISTPLVEDMVAVGKTPTQLARDIEKVLG